MLDENFLPKEGAGKAELEMLYSWTLEDAQAAQDVWDNKAHSEYAAGPLFRWIEAQHLLELGKTYLETKDHGLILEGLFSCSMRDLPIPKWCSMGFVKRYRHVRHFNAKSWDDAFGQPHPKHSQLLTLKERREKGFIIYNRVRERHQAGEPIDGALFESVGRELAIGSKTKTEEIYYEEKKWMENRLK